LLPSGRVSTVRENPAVELRSWLAALLVASVAAAVTWSLVAWRPWDRRMSAAATARALSAESGTALRYRCSRAENDGTIAMHDVDYVCLLVGHPERSGYWVGTDARRITELQPMG
jgi:hypothetical protein